MDGAKAGVSKVLVEEGSPYIKTPLKPVDVRFTLYFGAFRPTLTFWLGKIFLSHLNFKFIIFNSSGSLQ